MLLYIATCNDTQINQIFRKQDKHWQDIDSAKETEEARTFNLLENYNFSDLHRDATSSITFKCC